MSSVNYLESLDNDLKNMIKEAEKIKDIFIICKYDKLNNNSVIEVFKNTKKMLKYITKRPKEPNIFKQHEYYKVEFLNFLNDFVKDNNKYRTYNKKRVYKYYKTLELGKNKDQKILSDIVLHSKVQRFFRKEKLERVLKK
jgi:hypothetical protein